MKVALAVTPETPSLKPFVTSTSTAEPVGGVTTPVAVTGLRFAPFSICCSSSFQVTDEVIWKLVPVWAFVSVTLQPVDFPDEPTFLASWVIVKVVPPTVLVYLCGELTRALRALAGSLRSCSWDCAARIAASSWRRWSAESRLATSRPLNVATTIIATSIALTSTSTSRKPSSPRLSFRRLRRASRRRCSRPGRVGVVSGKVRIDTRASVLMVVSAPPARCLRIGGAARRLLGRFSRRRAADRTGRRRASAGARRTPRAASPGHARRGADLCRRAR